VNIPFLVRDKETGSIEIRHFNYEGPVSKKAWQSYNRAFMKLEAARYFFPEDGMDAYHEGLKAVEQAGERIASGQTRIRLARNILETLFPLLSEETARAFHGYLKADGNFVEAARIARISKTKYYRLWPKWIRAAKEIGEKHLVYCH